ncbi:2039_t:CDS:2, partial [Paraglomus brasilianum]
MEGQQEDNQTRNNLQQQAGMQEFAKKTYEFTSNVVNVITFIVTLIGAIVTIIYVIQIRSEITMMNETLRERMDLGFASIAIMHKIFAAKLDLVNEKWAFLEKKHDTLEKNHDTLEKNHDTLEQKVTDPQVGLLADVPRNEQHGRGQFGTLSGYPKDDLMSIGIALGPALNIINLVEKLKQ